MRKLTLKNVTLIQDDRPPVEGWAPGLRNVPLDVRMAGIKSQLADLGLSAATDQQLKTGLLRQPWNGFPRHALVVWAGQGGAEWTAVSDEAALSVD